MLSATPAFWNLLRTVQPDAVFLLLSPPQKDIIHKVHNSLQFINNHWHVSFEESWGWRFAEEQYFAVETAKGNDERGVQGWLSGKRVLPKSYVAE